MTCEIRSNGTTQIRLIGERPIERQAIAELLEGAAKGQRVQLSEGEPGAARDGVLELVITLEHGGTRG